MHTKFLSGSQKETDLLEEVTVGGIFILNWIVEKQFAGFRVGTIGGSFEHDNEPLVSMKAGKFLAS